MSRSASSAGDMFTMKVRNLVQAQKPEIKINFTTKKKFYTTLDRIEGTAIVTPAIDTNFDTIEIEFVGTSRTYVERLTTAAAATGRSEAFHQFMKLSQPDLHQYYPEDLVLRAGTAYEFPFVFAVPQQLLPRVCQHTVQNDAIREAHFRLPPSFGDKESQNKQKGLDDMAPDMASIRYGVFVKISEVRVKDDEVWRGIVASKARKLRVVPVVEEQPPLDVHQEDGDYVMRKEKSVRKGVLKGKAGTLVMTAEQPAGLRMKSFNNPEDRMSSMGTVMLRFDPLDDDLPPPKLGNLSTKLKVTTYFASTARHSVPNKNFSLYDLSQGLHTEQMNLSSRPMGNVEWTKQDADVSQMLERRGSTTSTGSLATGEIPEPSDGYKGGSFYTARLIVPITLPGNKAFLPTFHTCLISRVYTLKFDLSLSSVGIGPSMDLKVPVNISSEGLVNDEFRRRESVESYDEAEVDVEGEDGDVSNFFTNVFEPRTIRVPADSSVGRSRIGSAPATDAPPDYSPFGQQTPTARMTYHRALSVPVY